MVIRNGVARVALLAAVCGCTVSPEDRSLEDQSIGIVENAAYRFVADQGLLHVTDSSETVLTARATAAEFSATFRRKRPDVTAVDLRIANLPANPSLDIAGVGTAGVADPTLALGYRWTVSFPVGVDEITVARPAQPAQDFRLLAFGDIQNGISRFPDMVRAVNTEVSAEFILMLGDLSNRAVAAEFDEVQRQFAQIIMPIYATPGNHDVFRPDEYQARFGRANYSFTHRGVRFTSIDSSSGELAEPVWGWARDWMSLARSGVHVIFSHIPAIEASGVRSGQWNSRREATKFVAMAREHRVDLMLFGHIHSHDSYSLAGIPTHVSGGCGAIEERYDGIDRHYLRIDSSAATGALRVEVVRIE